MFIFEQIRTGGDRNFGYLLGDRGVGKAVVVDPSFDPERMVDRANAQGLDITHIINTHGHPDHTNGNDRCHELTGAPVVAHRSARPAVGVEHDDVLQVGSLTLRFLFTPGHADDHVCVLVDDVCLTGDVLFVGKVGGTAGSEAAEVEYRSLTEVLLPLPGEITVWPGHDFGCRPSSTLSLERRTNPFLQCPDFNAFLELKQSWPVFKTKHGLV